MNTKPNVLFLCRKMGTYPNVFVSSVMAEGKPKIQIVEYRDKISGRRVLLLDPGMARLLARRIVQCLEEK